MYLTQDKHSTRFFRISIILLLVFAIYFRWVNHGWKKIVESDGRGYYAYLPSVISYNDLSFKHYQDTSLFKPDYKDNFLYLIDGKYVIKYPAGVAVMLTPFYIVADVITRIAGFKSGGYSFFYMVFVSLAAIFYALAGIYYCLQLLSIYKIPSGIRYAFASGILFGSNLLIYTIHEPSMSHVYSFAATAAFLYHLKCFLDNRENRSLILAAISIGLIILIRPVNGIIVFALFLLFTNKEEAKRLFQLLFSNISNTLIALFFILIIIAVQPILWYLENGHFILWTYLGETFNWNNPEILNVLFSYRKGWFVYTPFALMLPFTAVYLTFKRQYGRLLLFVSFWLLVIYIISSWWCWYYGGSFGQRAFIEFYPVIAISCIPFFHWLGSRRLLIRLFFIFTTICIILNLIQSYQYKNNILHYDSMDRSKYWQVFLKTRAEYERLVFINPNTLPPDDITGRITSSSSNDFESNASPKTWQPMHHDIHESALSGNHVAVFGKDQPYGPMYKEKVDSGLSKNGLFVRGYLYKNNIFCYDKAELAIALDDSSGKTYFTAGMQLAGNLSPADMENWWKMEYRVALPDVKPGSKLVIYIYSPLCKTVLDDISFFTFRQ
jgi:hypothetical protein